jgi:hypothetical protein
LVGLKGRIVSYKTFKQCHVVLGLPRNLMGMGKVQKNLLRQQ